MGKSRLVPNVHWFDAVHQIALRSASRRAAIRALVTGVPANLLANGGALSKNRDKGGGKGKGKGNDNPLPPERCGQDWCAGEWPEDDANRSECELKCGRCRIRDKFCIIEGDPDNPDNIATCCFEHQTCCAEESAATGRVCVDTDISQKHCGACNRPCDAALLCVGGHCLCPNPHRSTLCDGVCVDIKTNADHCGECRRACIPGERCQNGECKHQCIGRTPQPCVFNTIDGPIVSCIEADDVCCGGYYCSPGQSCCETYCGIGGCNAG